MSIVTPADAASGTGYDDRDSRENFPVAMRLLPRTLRDQLRRAYALARHIDDLGDEATGDRRAALQTLHSDIDALFEGRTPHDPVVQRLAPTVAACGLTAAPWHDLIEANLQDQHVHHYRDFDDLLDYCRLSANPVGHIVLQIFGADRPELRELSDPICSALQVLEHCQDVVEDHAAGRVYLPQTDLRNAGVDTADPTEARWAGGLRAVVLLQVRRCRAMMTRGRPLLPQLHGWARIAVAGYLAGGLATADALERAHGDVVHRRVRPRTVDVLRHVVMALLEARGGAR